MRPISYHKSGRWNYGSMSPAKSSGRSGKNASLPGRWSVTGRYFTALAYRLLMKVEKVRRAVPCHAGSMSPKADLCSRSRRKLTKGYPTTGPTCCSRKVYPVKSLTVPECWNKARQQNTRRPPILDHWFTKCQQLKLYHIGTPSLVTTITLFLLVEEIKSILLG